MTITARSHYQESSESAQRHWEIPHDRLEDTSPVASYPAAVLSQITGNQVTGTLLVIDDVDDIAIIDFTCSMVYRHTVRNVDGYSGSAENSWAAIDIGNVIFYDRSATMPAGTYLSQSANDNLGAANPQFGHVVPMADNATWDTDEADYPTAATALTATCGVMQSGAGTGSW